MTNNTHNFKIYTAIISTFISVLLLVVYRHNILFFLLRYKLPGKTTMKIVHYLSTSKKGIDLAINDLSTGCYLTRNNSFFILLSSDDDNTHIRLANIAKQELTATNSVEVIEALCILLVKTDGDEQYINQLFKVIYNIESNGNYSPGNLESGKIILRRYASEKLKKRSYRSKNLVRLKDYAPGVRSI